jgi:predicted glutamine amidotransferase
MCRLLGYVAPLATTLSEQVGDEQVARFREMSCLHRDGWGSAWLEPASAAAEREWTVRSYRTPQPAPDDPRFETAAAKERSPARLVHLRWASPGMPVADRNSHPFLVDGIAFAHNGAIAPRDELDNLLAPDYLDSVVGDTDSERYLALIRQELADTHDLPTAVARAVGALRSRFPLASLNALLLNDTTFITVHSSSASRPPLEQIKLRGTGGRPLPLGHDDNYFRMRWLATTDGGLLFSSTGLLDEGWQPLPMESITSVDVATMKVTVQLADDGFLGSSSLAGCL